VLQIVVHVADSRSKNNPSGSQIFTELGREAGVTPNTVSTQIDQDVGLCYLLANIRERHEAATLNPIGQAKFLDQRIDPRFPALLTRSCVPSNAHETKSHSLIAQNGQSSDEVFHFVLFAEVACIKDDGLICDRLRAALPGCAIDNRWKEMNFFGSAAEMRVLLLQVARDNDDAICQWRTPTISRPRVKGKQALGERSPLACNQFLAFIFIRLNGGNAKLSGEPGERVHIIKKQLIAPDDVQLTFTCELAQATVNRLYSTQLRLCNSIAILALHTAEDILKFRSGYFSFGLLH